MIGLDGTGRVLKFDANGTYLAPSAGPGFEMGKPSEPVGVAIAADGDIYVADAWNARIQRFDKDVKELAALLVPGWLQAFDNDGLRRDRRRCCAATSRSRQLEPRDCV